MQTVESHSSWQSTDFLRLGSKVIAEPLDRNRWRDLCISFVITWCQNEKSTSFETDNRKYPI